MKKTNLAIRISLLASVAAGLLLIAKIAGVDTMKALGNSVEEQVVPTDMTCPTDPACDAMLRSLTARGTANPAILGESFSSSGTATGVVGRVTGSVTFNSVGVLGQASSGTGVVGEVTSFGTGVVGRGSTGVTGSTTSASGIGVLGQGPIRGVVGEATSSNGLAVGVLGRTTSTLLGAGAGVVGYAVATTGAGVGVRGESNSPDGIGVLAVNAAGTALQAHGATAGMFGGNVNINGDLIVKGTIASVAELESGKKVALSTVESPEKWFEDFGSTQLQDGAAIVHLDPQFARAANTEMEYHIFLTPKGDCNGLYVVNQTPALFEVRELNGGTATVRFSYRIVAKRRGQEDHRLREVM